MDAPISDFRGGFKFLSNFYIADVSYDGVTYPSTEHAYQAAKTTDALERQKVLTTPTCFKAKRMGMQVTLRPDWDAIKLGIMEDLIRQKFTRHQDLREQLLATGTKELVEGNTWGDTYWGVCNGKGQNQLGKILMKVRSELAALV